MSITTIIWWIYNATTGQFSGTQFAANGLAPGSSYPVEMGVMIPAGYAAVASANVTPALKRYDLTLQQIVSRDPTPVVAYARTNSIALTGVPLGAVITIGGNASYTVTNTDPTGNVTLSFAVPGTYTVAIGCFPSQDFSSTFTLASTITPAVGALALSGVQVALKSISISVPAGGMMLSTTGAATPVSALVPKVAALALTGVAPTLSTQPVVAPNLGTVTITGLAGAVSMSGVIVTGTGSLTMTLALFPASGALTLASDATLVARKLITPSSGALVMTGISPVLVQSMILTPNRSPYHQFRGYDGALLDLQMFPGTAALAVSGQSVTRTP